MKKSYLLGIDLGGTNIKAVLTNPKGEILGELTRPTNDVEGVDNSAVWKATLKEMIEGFQQKTNHQIQHIGISSPGTVNNDYTGVISNGTKLLGIEGLIWKEYLNREIFVLNDAHAALFAESRLGIGKDYQNIIMLTLGTGVGGGIMINGQVLQGEQGRAGHIGHISVNQNYELGIVQTPGSLEKCIGECTIKERTYGKFKSNKTLVAAHLKGDTFATWVWLNAVQALARGIVTLINILSPEMIILGGGISKAGEALMNPLTEFLEVYEWRPSGFKTPIKLAALGNHAGAVGAALFAMEQGE